MLVIFSLEKAKSLSLELLSDEALAAKIERADAECLQALEAYNDSLPRNFDHFEHDVSLQNPEYDAWRVAADRLALLEQEAFRRERRSESQDEEDQESWYRDCGRDT